LIWLRREKINLNVRKLSLITAIVKAKIALAKAFPFKAGSMAWVRQYTSIARNDSLTIPKALLKSTFGKRRI